MNKLLVFKFSDLYFIESIKDFALAALLGSANVTDKDLLRMGQFEAMGSVYGTPGVRGSGPHARKSMIACRVSFCDSRNAKKNPFSPPA